MTSLSIPKSDREMWGLRGAVKVFKEHYIHPTPAPSDLQPRESRFEFNPDGSAVGRKSEGPFTFDQSGRKVKVRISGPEQYRPNVSAGGSPFSLADRRPNLPEGGTATTYYDEFDRPVEAEVRDARGGFVMKAVRLYDEMDQVRRQRGGSILGDALHLSVRSSR
jgi:hypothetical protein